MIHYHVNSQDTCIGKNGFFDIEEKTCVTVHRLAKVCIKVKLDETTNKWVIDKTEPDLGIEMQVQAQSGW